MNAEIVTGNAVELTDARSQWRRDSWIYPDNSDRYHWKNSEC